jgi:hypothetical protein
MNYITDLGPRQFARFEVDDKIEKGFNIVSSAELDVVVGVDARENRIKG